MKQWEMDELRLFVHSMNSTGLHADVSVALSELLDKFVIDTYSDVYEEETEQDWDEWLDTAPDPLTVYRNSLANVCDQCKGTGKEYFDCDQGHYGGSIPCVYCKGTGVKDDKI